MELTAVEQRVLGCLLEKAATTPENYPLTMNALVNACNQTSNRDPVVSYGDDTVDGALNSLRAQKLVRIVHPAHARATKFRHVLDEVWALSPPELAVIAVLLLRGAQTEAELATRIERYTDPVDFSDLGGVRGVLDRLAGRPEPLVRMAERHPGQREDRYAHLLGPAAIAEEPDISPSRPASATERIMALERETASLRSEVASLRRWIEGLVGEEIP